MLRRIEHVTERVEHIMGRGNGGSIVIPVGTDKEGTTAIVEKSRILLKKTKQARVGQIILSRIKPVFGNRIQGYRNSKRMAVNGMVKQLCPSINVVPETTSSRPKYGCANDLVIILRNEKEDGIN